MMAVRSIFALRRHRRLGAAGLAADVRGAASIEFAFCLSIMTFAMLAGVDAADFYVHRLQVDNATQMAAQAAWQNCDTTKLPATTNCTGFTAAVTASLQSTSLGTGITLQTGYPAEGYYCVNTAGTLQKVGDVTSAPPSDCGSVGQASDQPGDYVQIKTQYTYAPIFNVLNFSSLIPTSIQSSSLVRLK